MATDNESYCETSQKPCVDLGSIPASGEEDYCFMGGETRYNYHCDSSPPPAEMAEEDNTTISNIQNVDSGSHIYFNLSKNDNGQIIVQFGNDNKTFNLSHLCSYGCLVLLFAITVGVLQASFYYSKKQEVISINCHCSHTANNNNNNPSCKPAESGKDKGSVLSRNVSTHELNQTVNASTEDVLLAMRSLTKRMDIMQRKLEDVHASQTEMEHMLKFLISYYWDTGEELTPATLTFRAIGTLRFILAGKMLYRGQIDSDTSLIIAMKCVQLVKDWWFAKVVRTNRIIVDAWVKLPDNTYLKDTARAAMDYTRHALLRYVLLMLLPVAFLWYRRANGGVKLPRFSDSLNSKSYYLALTEVLCDCLLIVVFYSDIERYQWRYVSLRCMVEAVLGTPPSFYSN